MRSGGGRGVKEGLHTRQQRVTVNELFELFHFIIYEISCSFHMVLISSLQAKISFLATKYTIVQ